MATDISVIIAAYNVETYISRAVRTALGQEGVNVEVIAVNDASTDNTANVIARINDPRVKFITLPVNRGPGAARNAGIAAAGAPWIAILDGDDAFLPGRLARLLQRAEAEKADIVVDNMEILREGDKRYAAVRTLMFPPRLFSRLRTLTLADFIRYNESFLGGGIALGYLKPLFSAEFLRRHNLSYDPTLRIGEDYALMAEALYHGAKCVTEPEAGYLYTARAGSASHRLSLADITRIAEANERFLASHTLDPAAAQAQKRRNYVIRKAAAFTRLVDAIKAKNIAGALRAAAACPPAVLNLWRPVAARAGRLFG